MPTPPDGFNNGEQYFAVGDSATAAIDSPGSGLRPNGKDSYINWYRALFDPAASSDHNRDGSGKGCAWAHDQLAAQLVGGNPGQLFVIAYGNNDRGAKGGFLTASQSATCLRKLSQKAEVAGWTNIVWANIMPMQVDCPAADYDTSLAAQRDHAAAIDAAADSIGVTTWPRYLAMSSNPASGVLEEPDQALVYDCAHPNLAGHTALANHLRSWLVGQGRA